MNDIDRSLRGRFYREMKGNIRAISPKEIYVQKNRARVVTPEKIAVLYDSIEDCGLIQPIGVRYLRDEERPTLGEKGFTCVLVYGACRLAAWLQKYDEARAQGPDVYTKGTWELINAIFYPPEMTDEMSSFVEMKENLDRNDLTAEERKDHSAKVGRLQKSLRSEFLTNGKKLSSGKELSSGKKLEGRPTSWFSEWAETSNIATNTAHTWWNKFKAETGVTSTPAKASDKEQDDFFSWLEDAKKKRDEEEARAAAEKAKAEEEAEKQKADAENEAKAKAKLEDAVLQAVEDAIRGGCHLGALLAKIKMRGNKIAAELDTKTAV